jgi:cobalt/nickel transport protein
VRSRAFLLAGLVVTLLLAGVASYYASSHPDGLERVAEQAGFLDSAEDSPASDSPLAGYDTEGVDDDRVGGGVAGVVGSLLVLALAGGLFWALRRRTPEDAGSPDLESADSEA